MAESAKTRLLRWGMNLFPAYRRTGGRVRYIAGDFRRVRIELPLNWKTRNYFGTTFGGSIYAAVDPIYPMMLIGLLGSDYMVWCRGADIRFRKPGRSSLFSEFVLSEDEVASIRAELADKGRLTRVFRIQLVDRAGKVHASIDKRVYIRRKLAVRRRSTGEKRSAA